MVCLDVITDGLDPYAPRLTVDGVDTVECRVPPPHHVVFRGEQAERLALGELGVGDFIGVRFSFIPWDAVTLAEMARSSAPGLIPVLGEGDNPVIFLKAGGGESASAGAAIPAADGKALPASGARGKAGVGARGRVNGEASHGKGAGGASRNPQSCG
jgi:hypothetical protein